MRRRAKSWSVIAGIVLILASVTALLWAVGPQTIVEKVGVQNTYLTVLLLAAIGGLSTLTSTSLFAVIGTFAAGGANPLLLGLFAGVGIFLSDTIFFKVAEYGRASLPEQWERRAKRLSAWVDRQSKPLVALLVFLWVGFSPLPNDLLMVALAAAGYRYRVLAPLLLVGGVTIATITAYLGAAGGRLF